MKASRWMFLAVGLPAISIGCGAAAVPAAVDPFVGDWKLDPARSKAIDLMKVQNVNGSTYAFELGGGAETIAVDGTDQPGYAGTTLAVTPEGPDHWKVQRKQDGRVVITALWTLSPDGTTLSDDFTQFGPNGEIAVHVISVFRRTSGGAGFAGSWESPIAAENLPSVTLQIRPYETNGLSFVLPLQDITRNIKFDGKDYPWIGRGVGEGLTSSGHRVDERNLELTDKNKGTIRKTQQIEVSADHKTLTQTAHPVGQHAANVYVFERQAGKTRS